MLYSIFLNNFSSLLSKRKALALLAFFALNSIAFAQGKLSPVILTKDIRNYPLGQHFEVYEDIKNELEFEEISHANFSEHFMPSQKAVLNFGFSQSTFWLRAQLVNKTPEAQALYLELGYPLINSVDVFLLHEDGHIIKKEGGNRFPFKNHEIRYRNPLFILSLSPYETATLTLKVKSETSLALPLTLWKERAFTQWVSAEQIGFGLYYGLMVAMALYNLLMYFTIREPCYLYYVLFMFCFITFAMCLDGIAQQYLLPDFSGWTAYAVPFSLAFGIIFVLRFIAEFLDTKHNTPTMDKILKGFAFISWLVIILALYGNYHATIVLAGSLPPSIAFCAMLVGVFMWRKGYQPAVYFLAGWVLFLVGALLFTLRAYGTISSNFITDHSFKLGGACQAMLLSLAMAARFKYERIAKQTAELAKETAEHYRLLLEQRVQERTTELQQCNEELVGSQKQLMRQEKMAALGVLSAGVAYEIKSPNENILHSTQTLSQRLIQFEKYIDELLKDEPDAEIKQAFSAHFIKLDEQLALAQDGTMRISEIVQGLRQASRLDESNAQCIDVICGLESTLKLVRTTYKHKIKFVTEFPARLSVKCWPAQLNQVFMNLLVNACHAVETKLAENETYQGVIKIHSEHKSDKLLIHVTDNGCGIPEEAMQHIGERFFTTKGDEKGTGLGLSISRDILHKHGGHLEISSTLHVGTTMTVVLPCETVGIR